LPIPDEGDGSAIPGAGYQPPIPRDGLAIPEGDGLPIPPDGSAIPVAHEDTMPVRPARTTKDGAKQVSRTTMAQTIVAALWGVPMPPSDDIEVGWLLRSDEPLTARYAKALAELARACDADDPLLV